MIRLLAPEGTAIVIGINSGTALLGKMTLSPAMTVR
jgi:hypothetical protein